MVRSFLTVLLLAILVPVSVGRGQSPLTDGPGEVTLMVDWGTSAEHNVFEFADWINVYLSSYLEYSSLGPGGIRGTWNSNAFTAGISGIPITFVEGDTVIVTWYNSGTSSITFTPKVSFNDPDWYNGGVEGTWYDLTTVTIGAKETGTTSYTFTGGSAGTYSRMHVCRVLTGTNSSNLVCDKFEYSGQASIPAYYTMTVNSGWGSGRYMAGETVRLVADVPAAGFVFDAWTGDTSSVANVSASTTTLTMPAQAIGVTATYTYFGIPVISGTSGAWMSGGAVTVSGSHFGSKATAAPLKWDTFENGVQGAALSSIDPTWVTYVAGGGVYNNSTAHSGSLAAYNDPFSMHGFATNYFHLEPTDEVFCSYWVNITHVDPSDYGVIKLTRINSSAAAGGSTVYNGIGDTAYSNINPRYDASGYVSYNDGGGGDHSVNLGYLSMQYDTWVRVDMYKKVSTPGFADGAVDVTTVGIDAERHYNIMTRAADSSYLQDTVMLGLMAANGEGQYELHIDDVYIDHTRARVEIGDAPTWAACTHKEIQIPTAWSDGSITFTVNGGTLGDLVGKYLYVVDARGQVNANGFLITEPVVPASVVGRHVLYNCSVFDGNNYAPNTDDNGALAPDIVPLFAGQTASKANYSSYDRGINAIVIDIAGIAEAGLLSGSDFEFLVGNSSEPGSWTTVGVAPIITLRTGDGADDSDRVTIMWPDHAIQDEWLRVRIQANAHTGLEADDVFYFGHAAGETGNRVSDAYVNALDFAGVRDHQGAALITNPYDFNRDGIVDMIDAQLARSHPTNFLNSLKLIVAP